MKTKREDEIDKKMNKEKKKTTRRFCIRVCKRSREQPLDYLNCE